VPDLPSAAVGTGDDAVLLRAVSAGGSLAVDARGVPDLAPARAGGGAAQLNGGTRVAAAYSEVTQLMQPRGDRRLGDRSPLSCP